MNESSLIARWPALAPYLQSVLRIIAACIFMLSGTMKIFAFPAGMPLDGGTAVEPGCEAAGSLKRRTADPLGTEAAVQWATCQAHLG